MLCTLCHYLCILYGIQYWCVLDALVQISLPYLYPLPHLKLVPNACTEWRSPTQSCCVVGDSWNLAIGTAVGTALSQARVGLGDVWVCHCKNARYHITLEKKISSLWKTGKTMHFLKLIIHNVLYDQEENIYCKSHNTVDNGCALPLSDRRKEFTQPLLQSPNIMWFAQEAFFSVFAEGCASLGKSSIQA